MYDGGQIVLQLPTMVFPERIYKRRESIDTMRFSLLCG
jgi:hypothetical protein